MLAVLGQLFVNQIPFDLAQLYADDGSSTSSPNAVMPVLESTLPFIRLNDDEAARVRAMLDRGTLAAVPASTEAATTIASASDHDEHFDTVAETNVAYATAQPSQTRLSGWSGCLPLPFPAKIELVSLDVAAEDSLDAARFGQHLGVSDVAYFAQAIEPLGRWAATRLARRPNGCTSGHIDLDGR